ncbi:hypothetical protein [Rosenbergiella epipactidis]|uniref:hypothetical protein n=1 Tax=Rosenbergiella epipactidis TaxID=1544694 RepID=UPI001F4DACFD|nr:hypothetical protein [Rosenbergiella epipactidis]
MGNNKKPDPNSKTQKRKTYERIVSRKRKYTRFEIESWKAQDQAEEQRREAMKELIDDASNHFAEI